MLQIKPDILPSAKKRLTCLTLLLDDVS